MKNKTEIKQHALQLQDISLLPKHIKWISRGAVPCVYEKTVS